MTYPRPIWSSITPIKTFLFFLSVRNPELPNPFHTSRAGLCYYAFNSKGAGKVDLNKLPIGRTCIICIRPLIRAPPPEAINTIQSTIISKSWWQGRRSTNIFISDTSIFHSQRWKTIFKKEVKSKTEELPKYNRGGVRYMERVPFIWTSFFNVFVVLDQ